MTQTPVDPRRVDYLPLGALTPDPRNPKAHSIQTVEASIGRFGMLDPIVRDGRTGFIVSGHGRREALETMRSRGETPPEGIRIDPETGDWLVPVVVGWSSRSDTEAGAALIALNRTTELGGWVDDSLLDLLEDLDATADPEAFAGVGFGDADLEDLRRLVGEKPDLDALADEWEEPEDDAEGEGAGPSPDLASIVLEDREVSARWRAVRADYESDDEALAALLDLSDERVGP